MYLGDFRKGDVVRLYFTTRNTSQVPTTLAGTPAVSVYEDGSTTEITAGVTLTVDFDARTGLNMVAIDTSNAAYNPLVDFRLVITAGTVGGTSVVSEVIGAFSLENRFPGVIHRGVLDAGTVSSVTLPTGQRADLRVGQVLVVLSGAARGEARVLSAVNTSTGVCTPARDFDNAPGTARVAVLAGPRAAALAAADFADAFLTNAKIADAAISAAKFAAGAIDAAAIATDAITAAKIAADAIGASELAAGAAQEIADEILNRDIAGGASGGARNVRSALRRLRNRSFVSGGTLTVTDEGDSTAAWTAAVTGTPAVTNVDPT